MLLPFLVLPLSCCLYSCCLNGVLPLQLEIVHSKISYWHFPSYMCTLDFPGKMQVLYVHVLEKAHLDFLREQVSLEVETGGRKEMKTCFYTLIRLWVLLFSIFSFSLWDYTFPRTTSFLFHIQFMYFRNTTVFICTSRPNLYFSGLALLIFWAGLEFPVKSSKTKVENW